MPGSLTWKAPVRDDGVGAFAWTLGLVRVSRSRHEALFRVAVRALMSLVDEHVVDLSGGA